MNIANTIKARSGNLLFKMMMAKQLTTSDLTKPLRGVDPEHCKITYDFKDNSSITFAVNKIGRIHIVTGRGKL